MLERILEPELMDTPADATDYDTMDHSHVNRVFIHDFLGIWNRQSPILDIGTGTAQIPIEFCRQSDSGQVIALDAAQEMLKLANVNIVKSGHANRITCQLVDAKQMPFGAGTALAIMSNSIVHHIPEPRVLFAEIKRIAHPSATIFLRDLLRPASMADLVQIVETYTGTESADQQRMFAESLHAALTLDEVRALVAAIGYDPAMVQQTSDRHWTWAHAGTSK